MNRETLIKVKTSSNDNQNFFDRLAIIVKDNLDNENFGVNELAEELGMSRSMLHRKLKKIIGKSASDYISEKRLEKAKELLESTDLTAAEIAYKAGFNSPSYFNKVFKKHYQVSPGDLRKDKHLNTADHSAVKHPKGRLKIALLIVPIILLAAALSWVGLHFMNSKTDRSKISIAILPFDNLSDVENTQYFADGVVEDLLNRLSTIKEIKVISRTSSEMFREKGEKTVPEIGKLLGVSHVVEGSVQRVKDKIRISVQLIDTKTDNHVLSRQYDRSLSDFFQTQSEIANEIASELSLALTNTELETLQKEQTKSVKAFEYYQLGRFHSSKRTVEELHKGIEYYEKALKIDSDYAQAYAGLADNYWLLSNYVSDNKATNLDLAYRMLDSALLINPGLAEAHTVLGDIYRANNWKWKEAEKEFQKALEVNPNFSTAHQYYAELLYILGRNDEARKHINMAKQLDPFSGIIRFQSASYYYIQEEFEKALEEVQICSEMDLHDGFNYEFLFRLYLSLGDSLAALESFKKLGKTSNFFSPETTDSIYRIKGFDGIYNWQIETNNYIGPVIRASIYAHQGDDETALDLLEIAADNHSYSGRSIYLEFKHLYSNPRFIAIRKKMGLPPLDS